MPENLGQQGGTEIAQALKDFEKDAQDYAPVGTVAPSYSAGTSRMAELVMKYSGGLITEEDQANYLVFGTTGFLLLLSAFLFFRSGNKVDQNLIDIRKVDQSQFVR